MSVNLTPETLFTTFRKSRIDLGNRILEQFAQLDEADRKGFLEPTLQFLSQQQKDGVRSWATSVLAEIPDQRSFDALVAMFETESDADKKAYFMYTRFFALRAIYRQTTSGPLAKAKNIEIRNQLLQRIANDREETGMVWAESQVLLSRDGDHQSLERVKDILRKANDDGIEFYKSAFNVLRALIEFPLTDTADEILGAINSRYVDHTYYAVKVLRHAEYADNLKVARTLEDVILDYDRDRSIRFEAVQTLGSMKRIEAHPTLITALRDEDAEVREQAAAVFRKWLTQPTLISIIQFLLDNTYEETARTYFIDALRRIDGPEREITTELLYKEISGQDYQRGEAARSILVELGGWAAVQKLSQRQVTLRSMDELFRNSEEIVRSQFKDTIRQAVLSFYFAMGINLLIVIMGLILFGIGIIQITQDAQNFGKWLITGASGLFGIILSMYFNNPRKNAREDLSTLLNANVLFLGFLRQLQEIDATFKHAFIENPKFGLNEMQRTVKQIEAAMRETLAMTGNFVFPRLSTVLDKSDTQAADTADKKPLPAAPPELPGAASSPTPGAVQS